MSDELPNPENPHARHASTPAELVRMNAAKRRGVPLLSWRDDKRELRVFALNSGEYSIGRRPTMSVVIGWDAKVSALHAKVECTGGEWVISDDGLSTNGTWVNGELISENTRLRDMDVIRIGTCLLAFHGAVSGRDFATTVLEEADELMPEFDDTDREVLIELCRDYLEKGLPRAVETNVIARTLYLSENTIKKRLGKMYERCGIDPDDELPRGQKRAELMKLVVGHGIVSSRDCDHRRAPG
jgi:FHA domain